MLYINLGPTLLMESLLRNMHCLCWRVMMHHGSSCSKEHSFCQFQVQATKLSVHCAQAEHVPEQSLHEKSRPWVPVQQACTIQPFEHGSLNLHNSCPPHSPTTARCVHGRLKGSKQSTLQPLTMNALRNTIVCAYKERLRPTLGKSAPEKFCVRNSACPCPPSS